MLVCSVCVMLHVRLCLYTSGNVTGRLPSLTTGLEEGMCYALCYDVFLNVSRRLMVFFS